MAQVMVELSFDKIVETLKSLSAEEKERFFFAVNKEENIVLNLIQKLGQVLKCNFYYSVPD